MPLVTFCSYSIELNYLNKEYGTCTELVSTTLAEHHASCVNCRAFVLLQGSIHRR